MPFEKLVYPFVIECLFTTTRNLLGHANESTLVNWEAHTAKVLNPITERILLFGCKVLESSMTHTPRSMKALMSGPES